MIRDARVAVALCAAVLGLASPAWGYVRTTTDGGRPMRWGKHRLSAILYVGSLPPHLPRDTFVRAARAAANVWTSTALACTDLDIAFVESELTTADVAYDDNDRIVFRGDGWRKMPCDPASEDCGAYDSAALAVTSVFAKKKDGTIIDADIELNAVHHTWGDVVADGIRSRQDVQNVLAHEFGHFLGFDHNCYSPGTGKGAPLDHLGRTVPRCEGASAEVQAATMFASARMGDTTKRDLSEDDVKAVCDVYPPEEDAGGCALPRGPRSAPGGLLLVGAALLAIIAGRRRRT